MRGMPRFKMHYWSDPRPAYDDEFGPNVIDVTPIKKPTIGQLWYLFCGALLFLAFMAVALPLLGGVLMMLYYVLKAAIAG
ncbi:hypothetical protein [Aquitalea aquatilis]|uniref:hypothetical protein n=1 Tax=Aquitalea aquatilis TaxID=1537400 RepID=UPI0010BDF435|nr:hypothetical protein [Aquitalea aquatilis]